MEIDHFITILEEELHEIRDLRNYYRFLNNKYLYLFRRAYFQQRLEYIARIIGNKDTVVANLDIAAFKHPGVQKPALNFSDDLST